jgi:precorrin-3B C17-methyltransferase
LRTLGREKDKADRAQAQTGQGLRGRRQGRLRIVGIGPGDRDSLTPRAYQAVKNCHVVVGYKAYLQLLDSDLAGGLLAGKEIISSGMTQELTRAGKAIEKALAGNDVCLISSGDPGIYGMAGVILELLGKEGNAKIPIEIVPGVTAASSCASLLGAPLMNDFAVISLSDLLTDAKVIAKRIRSACQGDFVIVFYNPKSKKRIKPLEKAWQILLKYRSPQTPVGIVRNARRADEEVIIIPLRDMLTVRQIDMGATVIVGNSKTFTKGRYMITPRGYERKQPVDS